MTARVLHPYRDGLTGLLDPANVSDALVDRVAMAHDASHYLMRPAAVATPETVEEVSRLLGWAASSGTPVTLRSGGSSLSGQASGAGLLVDIRRHFSRIEVLDGGARVRCEPGAVLRAVNARLTRHGRKLGPDPASEIACTIGGIVANNSSGMSSGSDLTAYHTVESLRFVLPSGTIVDTAEPGADARLATLEPTLHAGLLRLRDRVRTEPAAVARIRAQFAMKNTMGYAINALLDHDSAVEILAHLVIGSEGTLAVILSATFRTVPVLPHASSALLVFPRLGEATEAIAPLLASGASSIELLDARSLRVAQRDPRAIPLMRELDVEEHTALLLEYQHAESEGCAALEAGAAELLPRLPLSLPAALTRDARERAALWHVRKGLYTAVAGARPVGTTALLEDIVVPGAALPAATAGLQRLLDAHGYDDAVVFGHARDANLHFMINPRLDDAAEVARYARFTDELVDLVLGHEGSLKAEHGTGRVMAPFVRRQYGDELYAVMREIKALCDPRGTLNPGVLLDDDPEAHLRHLKVVPAVDGQVDSCVECGYCEPSCPSRTVTTTPRKRIALMREIAIAPPEEKRELEKAFGYEAVDTCAADSLCVRACPVAIDTGKVMKQQRAASHGGLAEAVGAGVAAHWGATSGALRLALGTAAVLPDALVTAASRLARAVLGEDAVPLAGPDLPGPGARRPRRPEGTTAPDLIFFPSCMGSLFAPEEGGPGAAAAFLALCERAGLTVATPSGIDSLCCGTPFESKGFERGARESRSRVARAVEEARAGRDIPVVCEASSCTHTLQQLQTDGIAVEDAVTFVLRRVLPLLPAVAEEAKRDAVIVHPSCSGVHLGITDDLTLLAGAVAREVVVPDSAGCCGFAGDRGMLHPELAAGATRAEAADVAEAGARILRDAPAAELSYASSNRTCEMGLSRATGESYRHVLELLAEALAPV